VIARILRSLAGAAAVAAAALAFAQQPIPVPKLTGHVVDLTGTLAASDRASLDAKLVGFERDHGSQVVVLLVPSIGDETIEEFAGRVTDDWKLGRKGIDDGVLFVVAMHERRLRIAPGRGVSGSLTDALSKRIVSDIVAPHFKAGDFAGGIDAGADAIMKAVEGEALPLPAQRAQPHANHGGESSLSNFFVLAFFLVPVVGLVLRSIFGRFFGATITSGVTGVAAWLFFGSVGIVALAAFLAFLFTLLSGTGVGRGFMPGGWGGGGFGGGGFGGGGGGGGGFSGGGGGFDGGGASGSW